MVKKRSKMTHREMVYDPDTSTRRFKWFMHQTRSSHHIEDAWFWGEHAVMNPREVKGRWRRNPYPPGRRHDAYEQGAQSARDEIARFSREQARYRAER